MLDCRITSGTGSQVLIVRAYDGQSVVVVAHAVSAGFESHHSFEGEWAAGAEGTKVDQSRYSPVMQVLAWSGHDVVYNLAWVLTYWLTRDRVKPHEPLTELIQFDSDASPAP